MDYYSYFRERFTWGFSLYTAMAGLAALRQLDKRGLGAIPDSQGEDPGRRKTAHSSHHGHGH